MFILQLCNILKKLPKFKQSSCFFSIPMEKTLNTSIYLKHLKFIYSLWSIVRSADMLSEGELWYLGHRRKVIALCLLVWFITEWSTLWMSIWIILLQLVIIELQLNNFVATRNTRASAALGHLALVIPRSRTDQFSRSFLSAAVHLWNLLPLSVFNSGTLTSFISAYWMPSLIFFIFITFFFLLLLYSLLSIMALFWFIGVFLFLVLGNKLTLIK